MNQADKLAEAVTGEVVLPILMDLDKTAGQPLSVKVSVVFQGNVVTRQVRTREIEAENDASGEVRVVLEQGGLADSFSFSGESIFKGLSPGTGLSGFSIRGKLKLGEEASSTKLTARTNRYNVWNWGKDFVF